MREKLVQLENPKPANDNTAKLVDNPDTKEVLQHDEIVIKESLLDTSKQLDNIPSHNQPETKTDNETIITECKNINLNESKTENFNPKEERPACDGQDESPVHSEDELFKESLSQKDSLSVTSSVGANLDEENCNTPLKTSSLGDVSNNISKPNPYSNKNVTVLSVLDLAASMKYDVSE